LDSLSGRRLGPYELQQLLGRGGMGAVYRAVHTRLGQQRALKILPPSLAWEEGFVERFEREARLSAQLQHPNIIQIFDIAESEDFHYIVMALVEGGSLRELIQREGLLPPKRALAILDQLAEALDHAHRQGVVHRDLKPANMLVGPNDHIILADFGIARALEGSRLTRASMIVGTPEYLSPEAVSGGVSGPSSDLYALGILAYELVVGRLPFDRPDPAGMLYDQAYTPPPPPRTFRPGLPVAVETVLLRQLAKAPAERYGDAKAFLAALRTAWGNALEIDVTAEGRTAFLEPPSPEMPAADADGPATPADVVAGTGPLEDIAPARATQGRRTPAARAARSTLRAAPRPKVGWGATGSLTLARAGHTATALADGRVLVVGGDAGGRAAELYDPSSGAWARVQDLAVARHGHSATLLPNGRVAVIAGTDEPAPVEVFHPARGTWVSVGPTRARRNHSAAPLQRGQILVVGGSLYGRLILAIADLYNPDGGTWNRVADMRRPHSGHTANVIANGTLLITGGLGRLGVPLSATEIYDPTTGRWRYGEWMDIPRHRHAATVLPNGHLLVTGGHPRERQAQRYDPVQGVWEAAGEMARPRLGHTATLLTDGSVLVVGGHAAGNQVERYVPERDEWRVEPPLAQPRAGHTATLLTGGSVLVAGGVDEWGAALTSAELYVPDNHR
jgi:hypothetical protein